MNIKDKLKVYPWDKLSHYQWASWFAAVVAIAVMAVTSGLGFTISNTAALGAAASIITALFLGLAGEWMDHRANLKAGEQVHVVSKSDAIASLVGCLPSALPLIAVFLLG